MLQRGAVAAVTGRLTLVGAHLALAGRAVHRHARRTATSLVSYVPFSACQPEKKPVQLLGILEPLVDDHRGIRVVHDVLAELAAVLEDVVDDPAQEGDVRAGPEADVSRSPSRSCA